MPFTPGTRNMLLSLPVSPATSTFSSGICNRSHNQISALPFVARCGSTSRSRKLEYTTVAFSPASSSRCRRSSILVRSIRCQYQLDL